VRDDQRREVARCCEVHQHGVDVGERRAGQAGGVEQRVDPAADVLDRGGYRVGVTQVGGLVAGHLHRRVLEVEDVDLGAELGEPFDRSGAHAGSAAPAHDHPLAFVAEGRCHRFPL
jgi:hypothetical protein